MPAGIQRLVSEGLILFVDDWSGIFLTITALSRFNENLTKKDTLAK